MATTVLEPDIGTAVAGTSLPPGLPSAALALTPRRHWRDCLQEAWLGYLAGRNPRTVARSYLAGELLHEHREPTFTKLRMRTPDDDRR